MNVKKIVHIESNRSIVNLMRTVFDQYDMCRRTKGDPERDEYAAKVEAAVNLLGDREQFLIKERYMIDVYRKDYYVYNFCFDPAISKDNYSKIRGRAFQQLLITLRQSGIIINNDALIKEE